MADQPELVRAFLRAFFTSAAFQPERLVLSFTSTPVDQSSAQLAECPFAEKVRD